MREKLTIEPGNKAVVHLDRNEGKPVESRSGKTEYMRILDHDARIIFAPEELEQAITASGATKGDVIQIERITSSRWDVAIVHSARTTDRDAPIDLSPDKVTTGLRQWSSKPQPIAAVAPRQLAQAPLPPARGTIDTDAATMTAAFMSAMEAAKAAEQFAEREGLRDFRLNSDAIRSLAVTIYIQRTKG
jgi:hypothetical protein